jgi:predicted ribosome quality control (RQC) complex YloA/Tae2 family protein
VAELSGFEVLVLAKEVNSALAGTYVNNIYRAGGSQLVRFRRPGGDEVWLVVSAKKGVWLSSSLSEHGETDEFTSKLRGELERARFTGASQLDLDRVYQLEFEGAERRRLVVELMPPGNLIVLDREGRVRLALNEFRAEGRRVSRGLPYTPPTQSRMSPLDVGEDDVKSMLAEEETVGRALGRHVAIPRKYVAEALSRVGALDTSPSSEYSERGAELAAALHQMVSLARDAPSPCICETPTGEEIFAFPPRGLVVRKESRSMSALCDELFLKEATAASVGPDQEEARRKELLSTIAKLKRDSEAMLAEASKVRSSAERARSSSTAEALSIMKESGVKPSREPASSVSVASLLYDRAKQLEAKSAQSLEAASKLEKKVPKAKERRQRTTPIARRKGEWYAKFRWFFTSEGKLAVGGRDTQTNSTLLARHVDPADAIFHADLFGSPFFLLKGGRSMSEKEEKEVAVATVAFSSAWKTGLGSADAFWVSPDQVSSAAPTGEYLAKGSYSIRGKKNFVSKNIVELAVGVDGEGRVMAGPESAVMSRCAHYVVLRPHREKGSDTAKRVLKDLSAEGEPRTLTLDDVQRALPAGGGKVVRKS